MYTAHVDTFARDHLPSREQWPDLIFELPELQYPSRLNCASVLLDDAIVEGYGGRVALRSPETAWTYRDLLERSNQMAHVLVKELGLVPGNRVLLRGCNCPMLVAAWFAVLKAGGIALTTMPMLRAHELSAIARKARIDHVICERRFWSEVQAAAAETGLLRRSINYGAGELEVLMAQQPAVFENAPTAAEDVSLLAFTSGSTGEPKATIHFHRDVLAMADTFARHLLKTSHDDLYIGSPPLGFTLGLGALLVFPLRFRAAAGLLETPTPDALLNAAQSWRATCLFTAPTTYRAMLGLASKYDLSSLRRCVSAGEALPKATSDAWFEQTGVRIIDGIGATEMIHIFISAAGDDIRPGATGKALPGYRACILDEEGRALPPGVSGRLAVKGPTGCRYLADDRQRSYVQNGWNVTGDRYYLDADGYFWFQARADDMIVSSGYNISGPEVEWALLGHPAVHECAVIGSPDLDRGNVVKAFVVLKPEYVPSEALRVGLQDFVKRTIAPYKYPREIVFVDSLPKTATGKLQRYVLREQERASDS
ncbi:MAG TPA: AMP-binding protein [Steroidobacter sp.]|jgi:2-aminobenzoate-CoA ligase|nr:AMP-binding protein [Steroidobacter sp.]